MSDSRLHNSEQTAPCDLFSTTSVSILEPLRLITRQTLTTINIQTKQEVNISLIQCPGEEDYDTDCRRTRIHTLRLRLSTLVLVVVVVVAVIVLVWLKAEPLCKVFRIGYV